MWETLSSESSIAAIKASWTEITTFSVGQGVPLCPPLASLVSAFWEYLPYPLPAMVPASGISLCLIFCDPLWSRMSRRVLPCKELGSFHSPCYAIEHLGVHSLLWGSDWSSNVEKLGASLATQLPRRGVRTVKRRTSSTSVSDIVQVAVFLLSSLSFLQVHPLGQKSYF